MEIIVDLATGVQPDHISDFSIIDFSIVSSVLELRVLIVTITDTAVNLRDNNSLSGGQLYFLSYDS